MKLQFSFLVALAGLGTTLAAPAAQVTAPAVLAPRADSCPTVSSWQRLIWTTSYNTTRTAIVGVSQLGSVTSTKTENETRQNVHVSTVISPATTTLPATTTTITVATSPTTQAWWTDTLTVRVPDYSPASACQVTTTTNVIPGTSTYVQWIDYTYSTTWVYTTGHVSTKTQVTVTTSTRTTTQAGATVFATTVTKPYTWIELYVITTTVTSTLYEKGCKTYACQG
ncbi:hypothetical protein QBC35DRAFT_393429 [Podospora australis]|uniref:Uncharacterized protein n=1 Tax=Podospora australis TaxID=1536484 RepID=A0AAN7ACK5_9PEZI|nr:hypothetical protein QBC35DRAFT_393429 [Podospora australis]